LHVVSTTPGRNVHEGTAQLGVDPSNPETYAAGAWLENGATLREIHSDHVVLERDGLSTELYVEGVAVGPNVKKIPKVNEALASLDTMPSTATSPRRPPPPTYTDIVRAAPRFETDLIVGFDLYPGTDRSQFSRLGLQSGDLLVSIDGVPMNSTDALHAALQSMRDGQAVTAVVLREGQSVGVALEPPSAAHQQALAGDP
jgi:general secretion pathway protein C